MIKSSLRQVARPRPTTPSIAPKAPFTSGTHQRRQSSSKPPVPPNNGSSPTIPADVKQVTARSRAKSENKEVATERLSRKKAAAAKAQAVEAQNNWTSTLPSVPSLHHLSPKDLTLAAFYATYRPISITGPGPKEFQLKDVEKAFQPKPARTKAKENDVIYTLSSALENLNDHIETRQGTPQEDNASSPQKELFRVVDGSGNHFKIVSQKDIQNPFRPFQPPPAPKALTQEQIDALDTQPSSTSTEATGEELLAAQLEQTVISQQEADDQELPASRRRAIQRYNQRQAQQSSFAAILQPQRHPQTAQIVLTAAALRKNLNFFTPSEPAAADEAQQQQRASQVTAGGRQRRGFAVIDKRRRMVYQLISVKRQRKLKMKKHKYKKLMRKTRTLRRRQDKI